MGLAEVMVAPEQRQLLTDGYTVVTRQHPCTDKIHTEALWSNEAVCLQLVLKSVRNVTDWVI